MKKFVSLVLAVVLLATMLTVFGIPAFAEEKQTINVPSDVRMHYTGEELIGFEDTDLYTVENGKRKDCGRNYVDLTLRDTDKYKWEGTDGKSITVSFEVHQYFDRDKNGLCDDCGKADRNFKLRDYYLDVKLNENNSVITEEKTRDDLWVIVAEDEEWGTANDDTWYVVNGSVELKNRPVVKGNVHIILKDYATLTANHGITVEEGNSISFYAQSDDENIMGKLTAETDGVTAIGGRNGNDAAVEEETLYIQPGGEGGPGGDIYFCGGSILLKSKDAVCIGGGNGGHGQIHKYAGGVIKKNGSDGGNGGKSGKVYFYGGNVLLENNNTACIGGGNGGDGGYSIHLDMNKKETRVEGTDGSKGQPGSFTAENDLIVYGTPVMKAGTSAESAILLDAVTDYTNQSFLSVQYNSVSALGSVLSNGSIWIIAAVAVVAVAGVVVLVIVKKKNKPALANGTDEE